jgi:hypothetical protein
VNTEIADRTAADAAEAALRSAADADLLTKINATAATVTSTTALIRKTAGGAIHIGENSLVTEEVGGVQELYAQNALEDAIDINVTNGSDLLINGKSVATEEYVDVNLAEERTERIAGDTQLRRDYQAADKQLGSRIDKNTRGIAMVAAMTNTTIQAGKTNAVDFNMAQFEGESGFSFGYAHAINEYVQFHGAAASGTDFKESAVRLGVSVQW